MKPLFIQIGIRYYSLDDIRRFEFVAEKKMLGITCRDGTALVFEGDVASAAFDTLLALVARSPEVPAK